jgi:hypothetical protein
VADGPPQHIFTDPTTLEQTGLGAVVGSQSIESEAP